MNWEYLGNTVTDVSYFPKDVIGFIYKLTLSDGRMYIGKKSLYSKRKRKFGKKEIAKIKDKRLKTYEYIIRESDWKTYNGSSELTKILPPDVKIINRQIIDLAKTDKHLTYLETKHLFINEVLEKDSYCNSNILGKFFNKDIPT